jgi:hypothetical protein
MEQLFRKIQELREQLRQKSFRVEEMTLAYNLAVGLSKDGPESKTEPARPSLKADAGKATAKSESPVSTLPGTAKRETVQDEALTQQYNQIVAQMKAQAEEWQEALRMQRTSMETSFLERMGSCTKVLSELSVSLAELKAEVGALKPDREPQGMERSRLICGVIACWFASCVCDEVFKCVRTKVVMKMQTLERMAEQRKNDAQTQRWKAIFESDWGCLPTLTFPGYTRHDDDTNVDVLSVCLKRLRDAGSHLGLSRLRLVEAMQSQYTMDEAHSAVDDIYPGEEEAGFREVVSHIIVTIQWLSPDRFR